MMTTDSANRARPCETTPRMRPSLTPAIVIATIGICSRYLGQVVRSISTISTSITDGLVPGVPKINVLQRLHIPDAGYPARPTFSLRTLPNHTPNRT